MKKKLLNRIPYHNYRAFDLYVHGRSQTGSHAENQVWKLGHHQNQFSDLGTIRIVMQERKPATFNSIDLRQFHKNPIGILIQQLKPKILEKNEFE